MIEWADRSLHDQPLLVTAIRTKIIANADLGRPDEACANLAPVAAPEFLDLMVAGPGLAGLLEG